MDFRSSYSLLLFFLFLLFLLMDLFSLFGQIKILTGNKSMGNQSLKYLLLLRSHVHPYCGIVIRDHTAGLLDHRKERK